jgi:hypothetical protein
MKTVEEINRALDKAHKSERKFYGMTYEAGVEEALGWVLEEIEDSEFYYSDDNEHE